MKVGSSRSHHLTTWTNRGAAELFSQALGERRRKLCCGCFRLRRQSSSREHHHGAEHVTRLVRGTRRRRRGSALSAQKPDAGREGEIMDILFGLGEAAAEVDPRNARPIRRAIRRPGRRLACLEAKGTIWHHEEGLRHDLHADHLVRCCAA